ncbi:DHA2 family efflux MFS transporter permease subunit [Antarcticirhabdus aurantiaca]|uniref:DHA2 family efflux MFS transporter permease subunit n=1 Tax=Antarcticirhabdus aurantiaca TaxID=2606717 RepID=A0ACD4NHR1_9HYPH|nr:DHA2 family efflux MFS transporter permease subunit [Antarcticirhabdus aurantiaca]WAJ26306.1 DHA2 family efflux MFS transporter permease subunit [Jeongeuplla avenae]
MAGTAAAAAGSASRPRATNPWIVAVVVSIATFMEVLDTTIANVALRYISGGLAVSADEASWVVTTYLVANAIVLTASSFIAKRFGRKRFYLVCLALFTASSVLCGFAWNIESLLFFRVLQGFAGGGMVPISQSILADSFPPEKRGQAFALFGVAVVVAPVVGPTLGGWLSDNYSWHWCFLINGPVGLIAFALVWYLVQDSKEAQRLREDLKRRKVRFDIVGFLLVAGFLGSLELILDRGQIEDWFGSPFIIVATVICVTLFAAMIPWELRHGNPVVDIRMVLTRQFGSCFLVMMATGAILIATTQFMPQLLQEYYGYTATWAGLALSPGGFVTMCMMFVVGRLTGFVQPKYLIALGAAIIACAMWDLTRIYAGLDFGFFAWSRVYIGIGLPLIFIPITTASYDGIPPDKTDQASALINVARNVGGSIGVCVATNTLAHREQFHQSRLVENLIPSDVAFQQRLSELTSYFLSRGVGSTADARAQALAVIGRTVQEQAGYGAYIDVFFVLMIISACAIPLALILRNVKLGGGAPSGAH